MFNAKTYRKGITYTIRVTDIKANDRCFFVVYLSSQLNSSFTLIRSYWQNRHTCHISETNDDYYRINGMMLCYVKINPIWIALWIAFPLFSDKSRDLCPVEKQIIEVILIRHGWYMLALGIYNYAMIRFLFLICYHEFTYQNKITTAMF